MLELINYGLSREKAYKIVQRHAQKSWKNSSSFFESISNDKMIVKKITTAQLRKIFDTSYYTKRINVIYKRVFH